MFAASGAPFKVTGQVTDESGETLIGVSVQTEGGKKIGQMTDIDGNYSITLDGPAELVFGAPDAANMIPDERKAAKNSTSRAFRVNAFIKVGLSVSIFRLDIVSPCMTGICRCQVFR